MSYNLDQNNGDIVINGFEQGVAPSPHKGFGNLQNVNISTETGEAMCSFNRIRQSQVAGTGTLTQVNTNTVSISGVTLLVGTWITIVNAGTTGLSGSYYYLSTGKLSNAFSQDIASAVSGITSGSATFSITSMTTPTSSATETYYDSSGNVQYRYYILDDFSMIWVHDTAPILTGVDTPVWFNINGPHFTMNGRKASGIVVLYGWLAIFLGFGIYWLPTCDLTRSMSSLSGGGNLYPGITQTNKPHFPLVGHQGKLYYTDGTYVGSVFPNTSLLTGAANVQSNCSYTNNYTGDTTLGLITDIIGGSLPYVNGTIRVPAMFFAKSGGALPTALNDHTVYYIELFYSLFYNINEFDVYAAATGGLALDITTGASGTQFFNTFNPVEPGGEAMYTFTPQRLNLPYYETAQCLAELGNTVVIGGSGNVLYPWDQISPLPADLIPLPENDTHGMITVNNMLYVFAGHKGNIYLTNGSSASLAISVPDYCAGIAGTSLTYIEPYFSWGGAMYCRGRVYFSVLDQTATKAGNCGGIWSFVPTQNFYIGQDTGLALRLENQNSYGTYSGYAPVLINSGVQTAIAPQYWSGWVSDVNTPTYGIDFTGTVASTQAIIETDLMSTGTMMEKKTFRQLEYKLSTPLATGEYIGASYRVNSTDAWVTCGSVNTETSNVGGYFQVPFEKTQWVHLKITLNSTGDSTSSFCRLSELRLK